MSKSLDDPPVKINRGGPEETTGECPWEWFEKP